MEGCHHRIERADVSIERRYDEGVRRISQVSGSLRKQWSLELEEKFNLPTATPLQNSLLELFGLGPSSRDLTKLVREAIGTPWHDWLRN